MESLYHYTCHVFYRGHWMRWHQWVMSEAGCSLLGLDTTTHWLAELILGGGGVVAQVVHDIIIVAGSGVVERLVRDSRLPSRHKLHVVSSQGCWQQPPLVIRRPQPSARPPRRWNWTMRASEASRRLLEHFDIRRTQYAYFYGTRSIGLCVTMKSKKMSGR